MQKTNRGNLPGRRSHAADFLGVACRSTQPTALPLQQDLDPRGYRTPGGRPGG